MRGVISIIGVVRAPVAIFNFIFLCGAFLLESYIYINSEIFYRDLARN